MNASINEGISCHEPAPVRRTGGWSICSIAAALLLPLAIGCASVPRPVTIRHESTPSQSDAAVTRQQRRENADQAKVGPAKRTETAASTPAQQSAAPVPATGESAVRRSEEPAASVEQGAPGTEEKGTVAAQETHAASETHKPEALTAAPAAVAGAAAASPAPQADAAQPAAPAAEANGTAAAPAAAASEEARAAQEAHEQQLIDKITARVTEEMRKKVEDEVKSEVQNDVMNEMYREIWKVNWAMKEKEQRFRFGGDVRLRYEADRYGPNNSLMLNPSNPTQLMDTTVDHSYFKYRVRFGVEAKVNEQTEAVIRLSTGTTSNPVSTNQTMNDYFNKDSVVFDLAYIRWQPGNLLTFTGGRMPNPFFTPSDLIWDPDVNFDGFAAKAKGSVSDPWSGYLTAGAFPLQTYDFSGQGKWLFGGQTGLENANKKGMSTKLAAAYYAYRNVTGVQNNPANPGATDWTAPQFMQKGNTLFNISADPTVLKLALAAEYKELNFAGALDIGFWDPVHVVLVGDYVKNIGFNRNDVIAKTHNPNQPAEIVGYQFGISVGYPTIQEKKQWRTYLYSKHLEADAVLDAFADSDFHLGGTNAKGWIMGAEVGIARNQWLSLKWLTADQISGPTLAIDVLFVDFNVRF